MKIRDVRAVGLRGGTPEGGWTEELRPEDCVHTLVAVLTDEDVCGVGSVFAGEDLVRAALGVLEPLYRGESALEPNRQRELTKHLLVGGALHHPTPLGIDIALWDILGKVTGQPVGRLLGGRYRERVRPYASGLMQEPGPLAEYLLGLKDKGFNAFKMGWGPFGRVSHDVDEAIVSAARDAVGADTLLMVDAGGSDAFWPHGLKWALRTAEMLADYDVYWFEEPLKPDALDDYVALRRAAPLPIAGGEVLTRRQAFQPWLRAGRWTSSSRTSPKSAASARSGASAEWPRRAACVLSPTGGTRRWGWPQIYSSPPPSLRRTWWSTSQARLT